MTETLQLRGTLRGHNGWVTQIATNPKYPDTILSCSRGKLMHISAMSTCSILYVLSDIQRKFLTFRQDFDRLEVDEG